MDIPEKQSSPWPRVFILVSGFLVLFLLVLVPVTLKQGSSGKDPWLGESRQWLAANPERNAFLPISEALERADWEALERERDVLRTLAVGGWRQENARVGSLLERHAFLTTAVSASAEITEFAMPPTASASIDTPRPRFETIETLSFVLVGRARVMAAQGHVDEAMERLSQSALLGARLCRPYEQATLSCHLGGYAMLTLSLNAMQHILGQGNVDPATIARLERRLGELDRLMVPVGEGLRADVNLYASVMQSHLRDTDDLAQGLQFYDDSLTREQALSLAHELFGEAPTFAAEHRRVWTAIMANFARPLHDQPRLDRAWLEAQTENRLVRRYFPDVSALAVKEGHLRATLRATRAACLLALGREDDAAALIDPFTGAPLRITDEKVYSLGPDREDQQGDMTYNPSRGIYSEGDIVVPRFDLRAVHGVPAADNGS